MYCNTQLKIPINLEIVFLSSPIPGGWMDGWSVKSGTLSYSSCFLSHMHCIKVVCTVEPALINAVCGLMMTIMMDFMGSDLEWYSLNLLCCCPIRSSEGQFEVWKASVSHQRSSNLHCLLTLTSCRTDFSSAR